MRAVMRTAVDNYKLLAIFIFLSLCFDAVAQSQTNISVDPDEARILNSVFRKWGISANSKQWNISGELCSGAAIDSTRMDGNPAYNPGIKCDSCTPTFCHITQLKVFALDVMGAIPDELWNLTFLTNLDLRQNYLTGPLSASIGNLVGMQYLAVGINSLSGELPKEIGNLTNLISLAIAFNNFSGPLPSELGSLTKLEKLDLSYNDLSGAFPSWLSEPNIQLNLAVNKFTIGGSNSSFLPSGLDCLQRGFPCNRDRPRYSNFSINCGGPQITTSDGIVYERDNETLGPATYYVTATKRWAVSNSGLYVGSTNPQYKFLSSATITNTLDPELIQTTRVSAGSLRYYGLGLQNGNYTVKLQFAEIAVLNPPTWRSLGKRIFDIYIQGNLIFKEFDIRKEAGSSFRAISKDYKVQVSENYLEVHLFWAGKGTCLFPDVGTYGPSISAISATPDFTPSVSNDPPANLSTKKDNTGLIVGILLFLLLL